MYFNVYGDCDQGSEGYQVPSSYHCMGMYCCHHFRVHKHLESCSMTLQGRLLRMSSFTENDIFYKQRGAINQPTETAMPSIQAQNPREVCLHCYFVVSSPISPLDTSRMNFKLLIPQMLGF